MMSYSKNIDFRSTTAVLDELESVLESLEQDKYLTKAIAAQKETGINQNEQREILSCNDCVFKTNSSHILTMHRKSQHGQNFENIEDSLVKPNFQDVSTRMNLNVHSFNVHKQTNHESRKYENLEAGGNFQLKINTQKQFVVR